MAERRHFRIDLEAMVQFSLLSEADAHTLASRILNSNLASTTVDSETVKINKQIQDGISMVTGTDLQLGHLLDLMNRKINLILRELEVQHDQQEGKSSNVVMPVNLSGGGALIYSQQQLESGAQIDLKITFLSDHVAVRSVARVIRSIPAKNDPHGPWKVAVEFTHMHEDDRDRVIRMVLHEQTKLLRERSREKE